jgi:tRNA(Ile)-lysidine synthase
VTAVLERVRAGGLLEGRLAVLLSGGRDSVCLLDCAVALADDVVAVHVDYGLRAEAAGDAAFCAELCEQLGVPLQQVSAGAPHGNVQAWARDVRLEAARATGRTVALGHTATDQVETVLYRLAAAPGRRALLGMRAREGDLVRPLLTTTRDETAEHCRARGLAWCEDATNATDAYARNRVRHGLVPELERIHPAAQRNVARTAELLRDEAEVLDGLVEGLAGDGAIDRDTLAGLPPALARLVVRRLAEDAVGRLCPRVSARAEDVRALEEGALDLGDGVRAVVASGVVSMTATPPLR